MSTVLEEVKKIHDSIEQRSASKKDEITVMQAMLNDREYTVDVYGKSGIKEQYCPSKDFREMFSSSMSNMTHMNKNESDSLVESYEFKRSDAETMVNVGKEFINTYVNTGRKIKLGGRETSDVSLELKEYKAGTRTYPAIAGYDDNGKPIRIRKDVWVESYNGIKATSPCPSWIKSNNSK